MLIGWLFSLVIILGMANNGFSQNVYASFDSGKLKLLIPASTLVPRIDQYLNNSSMMPKQLVNSRTERGSVRRFRTSFINRKIRVRFDYSYKARSCNKKPITGGWWCSPWSSDSGWAEVDLWPSISNWQVSANTRSGHIRWDSNNWFTQRFIKQFVDNKLRSGIAHNINSSIQNIMGGSSFDLRRFVINEGSSVIANSLHINRQEAVNRLTSVLGQTSLNSHVGREGLFLSVSLNKYALTCISNRSGVNLNYRYKWGNGAWKSGHISPNANKWYSWKYRNATQSSPNLYVRFDTDLSGRNNYKTYTLKRLAVSEQKCNLGKKYYFSRNGGIINLFEY